MFIDQNIKETNKKKDVNLNFWNEEIGASIFFCPHSVATSYFNLRRASLRIAAAVREWAVVAGRAYEYI